jgi:predicted Zn finger-like uncharacterized protein
LFTQCPKCETVFKLSAEVLRAAGGQVRCGRCGEVFNALARLAEDASAFPAGESPLEMEARADEILHSVPVAEPSPTAAQQPEDLDGSDAEFARLQVIDLELYDDDRPPPPAPAAKPPATPPRGPAAAAGAAPPAAPATALSPAAAASATAAAAPKPRGEDALSESSLEFTLPPGELDRIFVESKPRIPPAVPAGGASAAAAATATAATAAPTSKATPAAKPAPSAPSVAGAEARKPAQGAAAAAPVAPRRRPEGSEISDEVRREMLAEFKPAPLPEIAPPHRRSLSAGVWLAAAIALALLLAAQIFHANRDWLAAKGIGLGLPPPANLSAYQLRQWGVTGDPGAKGALRVRASILNTAAQLQPYPLLRVTLANRFGSRIGTREFEPAEYLGKPTVRMLAPGERVDATLDILDPGKDAEGFEIDVCLRGADHKVACAADAAPQTKR